jgi:hypothetical protein
MEVLRKNGIDPFDPRWRLRQNPQPAETKKKNEPNVGAKEPPSTPL